MYQDCPAKLKMKRMVLKDGFFDEEVHICKVIEYIPEKECIYLLIGKNDLPVFSLDGIYELGISHGDETVKCSGVIKERYWNKLGRVIIFQIQNGFYKNPVN